MARRWVAAGLLIGLTACGQSVETDQGSTSSAGDQPRPTRSEAVPPTPVSQACDLAMSELATFSNADEATYNRYMAASLTSCASADEWLAAARVYPSAAMASSARFLDVPFLEIVCHAWPTTPTCVDGLTSGVLDGQY